MDLQGSQVQNSDRSIPTTGLGSYASGTVAGLLTRRYHSLLVAALKPPGQRTLLLAKLDDTAQYGGRAYPLFANRWASGLVEPAGYRHIESFHLDGTIPVWRFGCGDALLEKRVWMQPGANTTYVYYRLSRATRPLTLSLKALVNYRDYHSQTQSGGWQMNIAPVEHGVKVTAFDEAEPFYLLADKGQAAPAHAWYTGLELAAERERGLYDLDDHLLAGTFEVTLEAGDTFTLVASTETSPSLNGAVALEFRQAYEQNLLGRWQTAHPEPAQAAPDWVRQLVLAADQFILIAL